MEKINTEVILPEILDIQEPEVSLNNLDPNKVLNLKNLVDDYNNLRTITMRSLAQTCSIQQQIYEEIQLEGCVPELLDSYSNVSKEINTCLKTLTESYKNISSIVMNISKINESFRAPQKTSDTIKISSTSDIIKRIKNENPEN